MGWQRRDQDLTAERIEHIETLDHLGHLIVSTRSRSRFVRFDAFHSQPLRVVHVAR